MNKPDRKLELVPYSGGIPEEEIKIVVDALRRAKGAIILYEFSGGDTGHNTVGDADPRLLHFESAVYWQDFLHTLERVKSGEI